MRKLTPAPLRLSSEGITRKLVLSASRMTGSSTLLRTGALTRVLRKARPLVCIYNRKMMDFIKKITPRWLKTTVSRAVLRYRKTTWRNRDLPDFLIIGAQKSGTTSLYHYISQHPDILPAYTKEVHFFDGGLDPEVDNFKKGQAWYQAHFPLKRNINNNQKSFEVSPLYIFNPLTPKRIFELMPEIKLILVLRNPVERAISHYFHEKRVGAEPLSIMDAFQAEEERLERIIDEQDYKNYFFNHHSYKRRGLYHEQLLRYLDYFPMSSMLVINSDAFFTDPENTLRSVFQFVGVDPEYLVSDLKPRNVRSNRSDINQHVYEYLESYFHRHNQALYELLGKDFGW